MIIYIYDIDLNLVGVGDKIRFEQSIFASYYIACGYILSTSKFDVVDVA
jgi:hypothetical protein